MKTFRPCAVFVALMIAGPAFAQDIRIDIKEFMFGPKDLTVATGTRITWVNDDQVPHTIMETHKVFHSAALDTDDSFTYEFDNPGTFEYFCALHPQMIGKIVVDGTR